MARIAWLLPIVSEVVGLACTCSPTARPPACEAFGISKTVFTGTVMEFRNIRTRDGITVSYYLIRVDEVFKGALSEQREVFIDPGNFTSCMTKYETGERYIFFGGDPNPRVNQRDPRDYPVAWRSRIRLPEYRIEMCSPTRKVRDAQEGLQWLRLKKQGSALTTRVYGAVLQNASPFGIDRHRDFPLPFATLTLAGPKGTFETRSNAEGDYEFQDVPHGKYTLSVFREPFSPTQKSSYEIDLDVGGCAVRYLDLAAHGSISGVLLDPFDKPVSGPLEIELARVLPNGDVSHQAVQSARTDPSGRFLFKDVPAGALAVGVNIESVPAEERPYLPSWTKVQIGPNERVDGATVRLSRRFVARKVQVRVLWADGSPVVSGARAAAYDQDREAAFVSSRSGNLVELTVLEDIEYRINADWFELGARPDYRVDSDPVTLGAGRGPAVMEIRLRAKNSRIRK